MEYNVRMMKSSEWDALVALTGGDNAKMHWRVLYQICLDSDPDSMQNCLYRGYLSTDHKNRYPKDRQHLAIGFRPVFVPKTPDNAPDGTEIAIATMYRNKRPVSVPLNPDAPGCVPRYAAYSYRAKIKFQNPLDDPAYQIRAIKVGDVYIATCCVLRDISWDDLQVLGFGYQIPSRKPFLPSPENFQAACHSNEEMYWKHQYSWLSEPGLRGGFLSPEFQGVSTMDTRDSRIGFCPGFEGCEDIPEGEVVVVATMYLDGKPVAAPKNPVHDGDIPEYRPGMKVEFKAPLPDPAFHVKATAIGGKLISDRCILRNISWNDLYKMGMKKEEAA